MSLNERGTKISRVHLSLDELAKDPKARAADVSKTVDYRMAMIRGRESVSIAHDLLSVLPEVYDIGESKRKSRNDRRGRDLRVRFRTGFPIEHVFVDVKSSDAGVDTMRRSVAKFLYDHGRSSGDDAVDQQLAKEELVVLNVRRDEQDDVYKDFWDQVDRIIEYKKE